MRATSGSLIWRPDLGATVLETLRDPSEGYIGLSVMPVHKVMARGGTYPVIPAEVLFSDEDVDRSPRGRYHRSEWEYERGKYAVSEKGHEEPMDDVEWDELENQRAGLAEEIATRRTMAIILRAQEKRIAARVMNPSVFTPHNVAKKWSDPAEGTPVQDIRDGKAAFRQQCGMEPDALVISWQVAEWLKANGEIREQLKYTFPGIDLNRLTADQLAQILNVKNVLVAGGMRNASPKGKRLVFEDIWTDTHAALVKISASYDITEPCVGRTFVYAKDASTEPIVEQYREEALRSEIIRVRHDVDEAYLRSYYDDGRIRTDVSGKCCYLMGGIK